MAERVNISVPDALFCRLQAVKGAINVSSICQRAIQLEVERQEMLAEGTSDLTFMIERLRMEKKASYAERFYDQGFKIGCNDAERMSYDDFIATEEFASEKVAGVREIFVENFQSSQLYAEWMESLIKEDLSNQPGGFDAEAFCQGWIEGILSVWDKIKDKI